MQSPIKTCLCKFFSSPAVLVLSQWGTLYSKTLPFLISIKWTFAVFQKFENLLYCISKFFPLHRLNCRASGLWLVLHFFILLCKISKSTFSRKFTVYLNEKTVFRQFTYFESSYVLTYKLMYNHVMVLKVHQNIHLSLIKNAYVK